MCSVVSMFVYVFRLSLLDYSIEMILQINVQMGWGGRGGGGVSVCVIV